MLTDSFLVRNIGAAYLLIVKGAVLLRLKVQLSNEVSAIFPRSPS